MELALERADNPSTAASPLSADTRLSQLSCQHFNLIKTSEDWTMGWDSVSGVTDWAVSVVDSQSVLQQSLKPLASNYLTILCT